MMSRRFSDAQNYYQRMKELQEKLKQSEDERMRLEKKFNKILQTVRAEDRIRKLSSAKDNYLQLLEEDRMRSDRNDSLMQILDRIENRACSINAKTERLRLLRKHYEAYMERTYPGWKANESKFYESYNEKLKAINSHFRTLSNDYTDLPTWRTSQDIDISRDDVSSASAYSVVNFPQTSYLNTSSFNVSDQTGARSSNITNSDSQPTIYNNYSYSQPSREPSIQAPTFSSYKDVSNLGKGTSFKSSNYTLNNLANPIKNTFSTSYSKPASIVSDFDSEAFQLNNDVNNSRTRQSDVDIDKDFNTKPDYYTNDLLDRTVNNPHINSYSPRFSRYDSSRQPLKNSYNQISSVEKFSKYSRPSSYDKNYTPRSLTRSSSLDTFTTKYSPRYRYQHTSPSSYSGDKLFRSNSLGRIPQETRLSYPGAHDYGGGYYRKYSPRSRFSERKNYSTLSPMSTTNRIPSDAGYFSHRSTSPANSSTYSSYNTAGYSYNRYNTTPRLTRSNSFQKNYDPPYTATAPRRSVTSNLPYMSTLSRSQSFSEIDDLDYLSRKKNYDMSGWNQYPMGRERFYYDSRNSNNQPVNSYSNQYQPTYSPEPSYTTKSYSFQADKSTSTDDGYDEDRAVYGRRMNRVHYADDIDSSNSGPTLNYNDYTTERLLDNSKKTYSRDLNPQKPINEFGISTVGAAEKTLSSQSTGIHDRKKLSTKEEPDRVSSNELKSHTALPYSQQILQTLEERTEEDITQSTSENPSLGSEQHWENEIGKLKDIMNYDSQPDRNAPGYGKDHDISTEQPYRDYYNKSSQSPRQSPKPMDDQTRELDKTKENSQFPDLKQEIEMLKKKSQTTTYDRNGFKHDGEMTHSNSASDYQPNGRVIPNEQYPIQPPYYPNSDYDAYTSGHIPQEQKVPPNYHPQPTEYMTDNIGGGVTQRVSPSHLEESQVLEKQDQPEKYDKKYNDMGGSNRELNKSSIDYPPRQISPIPQSRDSKEYVQGSQDNKQAIFPHQESTTGYLTDVGQEQISPRNSQTSSDKSPLQSQYNIDNSNNDNDLGNTNIIQPPKGVKQEAAIDNSQADKISKINHPSLQKRNSSIGMNQNIPGLNIQNKKSSLQTQPEEKTRISSDNRSPLPLANVQSTPVNNQNLMKKENAAVKYDQTQPSLQTMHDNKQKVDTVQEQHNTPNISQNYQPQQQPFKNGEQQIRSDESKEQNQQPPTQTSQQLDETSSQQPVIQNQQQYEQQQYQNYAESEQDHYNYNAPGGDDYQPQYDNANAYQYNEDQLAQQYPDDQQYQEPQYPQQEQYPQTQDQQYPKTQDSLQESLREGQYAHEQEGQYKQQQEGQYLQQQEGQYPQQQEGPYPQQQEGQYPQQQDGQYPQQQEGQYPQQQEGQYPQQQDIQYAQQQGDQYPQPQEYQQKPMGNYPSQPDQQYPGDNMGSDQLPIDRQYPEGEMPEQFSGNPNEQQYHEQPYSGEQMPQEYMQEDNQQPYQDGQYGQQYDDGQMAQQYPADQYNNYQQDNQAYPENYYEQQQQGYEGYEQAEDHYQQNPEQYQATKPEEQFYPEGQVDNREQQPKDQYPPNEQTIPSAVNYEQQAEQQSASIPEQQVADNRPANAQQENQDKESNKLQEESQQETSKVEPEKHPSPESNKVENDKKGEAKSANSTKPDVAAEPTPATGEKPATKQPTKDKTADGKPEVKTPAAAVKAEKTAENSGGGTAKTTARAGDKKGGADAGGKSAGVAKTADGKPAVKKAGEKMGLKGAAVAARTASKLQK
ncbi:hypothetical protein LSTR_LSTR004340 [Laodelphax striatellus]|uniref:Uncharacterized protein n=1 Tax=Laodelphax striatellus TaxID=195883 RepID=A0A482XA55_LAOST|nr:hypothetical protein LSTR_LSTR004340 [Laodelphax striatellus]